MHADERVQPGALLKVRLGRRLPPPHIQPTTSYVCTRLPSHISFGLSGKCLKTVERPREVNVCSMQRAHMQFNGRRQQLVPVLIVDGQLVFYVSLTSP